MEVSRRKFLGTSAAAVIVAGSMAKGKVFGANDRIRVATIGFNGQGGSHIRNFCERQDTELVALCDVDKSVIERKLAEIKDKYNITPANTYTDMRDPFANDNVDAVSIATPNHWHSLAAIWACQAGKDVYVEKPLSHNVWEGRQLVQAARKNGRMVQHGTQSRSNAEMMRDIALINKGFLGDICHSRGYVYKNGNRRSIGHGKPATPPANLDWNLWQGPATQSDYMARDDGSGLFVHYNWHWVWPYGNGEIGNQGVHEMDIAVWTHNRGLPVRVYSSGGRYAWDDDATTPNTQASIFTYADGSMMTFEVRNLGSFPEGGDNDCSNSCFGANGYWVRNKGFFDYKKTPITLEGDNAQTPPTDGPIGNWLNAIRARDEKFLTAGPDIGHISCVHCHIGNIAFRLGRSLEFDPATEKFVNDDEANTMLTREYREPFIVPDLS